MSCGPRADHLPSSQQMTRSRVTTCPLTRLCPWLDGVSAMQADPFSDLIRAQKAPCSSDLPILYSRPHRLSSGLPNASQ